MINRLKQFNAFQDEINLLLTYLCKYFQSLSIDREAALLFPFFTIENTSKEYIISKEIEESIENIIPEIMQELLFFHKVNCYCYLENNVIRFILLDNQQDIISQCPDSTAQLVTFDFDELGYTDKLFQEVIKGLHNYSKKMNIEEKTKFHIHMLKLSKKIPFNAYTYCQDYITQTFFRYNEFQFLEHKAKIVQYILDKLNEGIKRLIGSEEIEIRGNFKVEEISKKIEELKSHNYIPIPIL